MRSPGPSDTSGRGLLITGALADTWGVRSKPGSTGKTVWAIVAIPAGSPAAAQAREPPWCACAVRAFPGPNNPCGRAITGSSTSDRDCMT